MSERTNLASPINRAMEANPSMLRRPSPFVGGDFCDEDYAAFRDILLTSRGFDLGMYKDRCIKRRIAARLRSLGFNDPLLYLERLRQDATEVDLLLDALSIHVSQFFRNPATFFTLEHQLLPDLIRRVQASGRNELRLWSAGCAGGEESYSLALLMAELAPVGITVKILGSDISDGVLEQARQGLFPPSRLTEVPPHLLERYFRGEGRQYRLVEEVRHMVTFFRQDLLAPGDYPQVDLILCRNVLIYFSREEQEEILGRFAAALSPGGGLVLGRAETLLGSKRRLFHSEWPTERIYRNIPETEGNLLPPAAPDDGQS